MCNRIGTERGGLGGRGHPLGYWLFVPITVLTIGRSLVHLFAPDGGAQSIATIPLDRMTQGGAEGVIGVFALWGLSQLLLGFVYVAVLLRFTNLLPLMYLLLIVEYVGRFAIGAAKPVPHLSTPPGATANLVFPLIGAVGLWLSTRRSVPATDEHAG